MAAMGRPPPAYLHATGEEWQLREQGRRRLEGLLAHVNKEEKAEVMIKQVEVVGGCRQLYELIDRNLRNGVIQHSLWKETLDLHRWRWNYFKVNLPPQTSWFSNTGLLNTISYQITMNFDQVVDACCSQVTKPSQRSDKLYLGLSSDDLDSRAKRLRIYNLDRLFHGSALCLWEALFVSQRALPEMCLGYGDVAKTLFEIYATSPPRLEELAMKTAKKDGRIAVERLPPRVLENDDFGFFDPKNYQRDVKNLGRFGRSYLRHLKAVHDGIIEEKKRRVHFPFSLTGSLSVDTFTCFEDISAISSYF